MNRAVVLIIVLLGVSLCLVRPSEGSDGHCSSPTAGPKVKVSFNSHLNNTGHWISQVNLQRSSDQKALTASKRNEPWQVDVEQSVNYCSGSDSILDVTLTLIALPRTVDPALNYSFFPGIGYYKFYDDVASWPRAREICAEEGAHLVIINSEEEADVVKKLFIPYPTVKGATFNDYAYVGVHRTSVKGPWITVFGDPLETTGYVRWNGPGNPKPEAVHDVVLVRKNDASLHNNMRNLNNSFICEQEIW